MKKSVSIRRWFSATSVLAGALFFAPGAQAGPFSDLIVFGDSISDSGNVAAFLFPPPLSFSATLNSDITNNFFIAGPPSAQGVYSNGPVWSQQVAAKLGVSALPSALGGSNFAVGGAETRQEIVDPAIGVASPSLLSQASFFFASLPPGVSAPSQALYVVQGGANNIIRLLLDPSTTATDIANEAIAYAEDIVGIVDGLKSVGAQHIIVWNVPDAGVVPFAIASGASAAATEVSFGFNLALAQGLAGEGPDVKIFDTFGAFDDFASDPAKYGLTNVADACGNDALGCGSNPLFWDGIHPSTFGHELLADRFLALAMPVPEPETYALMLAGLAMVGVAARRRKAA